MECALSLFLFLFYSGGSLRGLGLDHSLLELVNAAGGIDEFLLAGIKGVADVANADNDCRPRGAGFDHIATGATDFRIHIFRMDLSFHKRPNTIALSRRMARIKLGYFGGLEGRDDLTPPARPSRVRFRFRRRFVDRREAAASE